MATAEERLLRWAPEINVIKLGLSELLISLTEEKSGGLPCQAAISSALAYLEYAEQAVRSVERQEET